MPGPTSNNTNWSYFVNYNKMSITYCITSKIQRIVFLVFIQSSKTQVFTFIKSDLSGMHFWSISYIFSALCKITFIFWMQFFSFSVFVELCGNLFGYPILLETTCSHIKMDCVKEKEKSQSTVIVRKKQNTQKIHFQVFKFYFE